MKYLKSIDVYGHPIGVLYNGETKHKTMFGTILSIATIVVVLIYASQQLVATITKSNQHEITRKIIADIGQDGNVYFDDHDFNIMIHTSIVRDDRSVDFDYKIPEKIGRLKAYMLSTTKDFQLKR